MRAVIAKIDSKKGKWTIHGAILCPSTGVLAVAEWDYHGHIQTVAGIPTDDDDFNLSDNRYDKEIA